jgi:hypothetical protein
MTDGHAPPIYATLTMGVNEKAPVLLATSTVSDVPLLEHANVTVKALSIIGFRGSVSLQAMKGDGTLLWAAVVSFTDDIPNGYWLNTFSTKDQR